MVTVAPQRDTALIVDKLECRFGGNRAVDGVTFGVARGSITGLIGSNGAGKTTTFNCIAGLLKPNRGKVLLNGRDITGEPPRKIFGTHHIHRTFQIPHPFASMTVLENLATPFRDQIGERLRGLVRPHKIKSREQKIRREAQKVLELVGLEKQYATPAGELSGGQQKLLELARALLDNPSLLLLDEPTAGVNPSLAVKICKKLLHIRREMRLTIVLISHDIGAVKRTCDEVIAMDAGKVLMIGTPDEVTASSEVQKSYLGIAQ